MAEIKITLKKSLAGAQKTQKQTAFCLGLKRPRQSRRFKDTPALRGQIKKIRHLLSWEKA